MSAEKSIRNDIGRRLQEAVDGLRKELTRVEVWAIALGGFSKPVPQYRPDPRFELGPQRGSGLAEGSKGR